MQIHSSAATLKLITFDADGTLYADGAHMQHDSKMIGHIINLMRSNVHVAIVTAAGYPGQADKFEQRVAGLTATFRQMHLPQHIMDRQVACSLTSHRSWQDLCPTLLMHNMSNVQDQHSQIC